MKKWYEGSHKDRIPLPAHKLFFTMSTSTQSVQLCNSWNSFSGNVLRIHHTGQTLHPATDIHLFGPVQQHINSKQYWVRPDILTAITIKHTVIWKATMVNCYQTTWQFTPENRIVHKYIRHNDKVKTEVCQWKQQWTLISSPQESNKWYIAGTNVLITLSTMWRTRWYSHSFFLC